MTEQEKREKVIKGLECCRKGFCFACPHNDGIDDSVECKQQLTNDVLALLQAQEPQVMTREELRGLQVGHFLWVEMRSSGRLYHLEITALHYSAPGRVSDITFNMLTSLVKLSTEGVNKKWRCWTQRPSGVMQIEVAWDA